MPHSRPSLKISLDHSWAKHPQTGSHHNERMTMLVVANISTKESAFFAGGASNIFEQDPSKSCEPSDRRNPRIRFWRNRPCLFDGSENMGLSLKNGGAPRNKPCACLFVHAHTHTQTHKPTNRHPQTHTLAYTHLPTHTPAYPNTPT